MLDKELETLKKIIDPLLYPAFEQYVRTLVRVQNIKRPHIELERYFPAIGDMTEEFVEVEYIVKVTGYQN
jgi:hypothetical protein